MTRSVSGPVALRDGETVTAVVVTYNSRRHLPGLLASFPEGMAGVPRWRLVVVDNNSSDGSPDEVRRLFPSAEVIERPDNSGYAAAINTALRAGRPPGPAVILNPDVRLGPSSMARLLETLAQPGVGIAVPHLRTETGETFDSIRREPSLLRVWSEAILGGTVASRHGWSETVAEPSAYTAAHDVDWATGAVFAISPACLDAVGEWDESFFLYSEEVDYCRRARAAGLRIRYTPEAEVVHIGGEYGTNVKLWRMLVGNRARDFGRHHGPVTATLFRVGLALGELIRSPRGAVHRAGVVAALSAHDAPPASSTDGGPDPEPGYVWFVAQDWWYHNQAHSDFQLMREVARRRTVLVVNSLGLRLPRKGVSSNPGRRIARKLRSMAKLVRRPLPDNPGFHVMTPLLLPFYGDTPAARLNAWLVRQQVRLVAAAVGVGPAPVIGVTIPTAWPVVRGMARSVLLFNRSDLHSAFPEADGSWVAGLEDGLMEHADGVLYVSHELMKNDHDKVGDRGHFLDHGVDVEHFSPAGARSAEVERIPSPRVGFFGGLDDYVVDIALLRRTAAELPDVQLVLVGDATCSMEELTALPNVHWLGYRPYEVIPSVGRCLDVALMPWLDNEWIRFANPIKLKEYLALGLPVVTTDYPEVEAYRGVVRVTPSRAEFPAMVREALVHPGDPEQRRDFVIDRSWTARSYALTDIADAVRAR